MRGENEELQAWVVSRIPPENVVESNTNIEYTKNNSKRVRRKLRKSQMKLYNFG